MKFSEYTIKSAESVLKDLNTRESGLSELEAKERQNQFGFNEITVKKAGGFSVFLKQFKSPFFYLLFAASLVAFLIGEKIDSAVIFLFILINAIFGFLQETKAEKAISLLKKYIHPTVRVQREGKEVVIEKKFLVPGDIVLLEAGDIAPADLRVLKIKNFLVDESTL